MVYSLDYQPEARQDDTVDITQFKAIPILGCGRCLFRSVASHGVLQLSAAIRLASGMIGDPELHNTETQLADRIRMEVVDCLEVCNDVG